MSVSLFFRFLVVLIKVHSALLDKFSYEFCALRTVHQHALRPICAYKSRTSRKYRRFLCLFCMENSVWYQILQIETGYFIGRRGFLTDNEIGGFILKAKEFFRRFFPSVTSHENGAEMEKIYLNYKIEEKKSHSLLSIRFLLLTLHDTL